MGKARTARFGQREIAFQGLPFHIWSDLRHRSIRVSWPVFIAGIAVVFLLINSVFAALYTLKSDTIANSSGSFLDNLFFAIETFTTVGYGDMHPHTTYGHVIASVELFTGVLATAMITGLVFLRFTFIRPRIIFADVAPVAAHDGQRSLMIRLANQRLNEISSAQARVWILLTQTTAEGTQFRQFRELQLLRQHSPLFALSWTLIHPINAESPFFDADPVQLADQQMAVVVSIEGYDETTGQTVRARKTYFLDDIRFGHRFADMIESAGSDRTVLNYERFHVTEPEDAAADATRVSTMA